MTKHLYFFTLIFLVFLNSTIASKYSKQVSRIKNNVLFYIDVNGKPAPLDLNQNHAKSRKLMEFYKTELDLQNKNTPFNSAKSLCSLARIKIVGIVRAFLGFSSNDSSDKFIFSRTDVTFTLYTREHAREGINLTGNYDFKEFDVEKLTKIIFHGYHQNGTSDICILIKDNYLNVSDINVIIVDYRSIAKALYFVSVYSLGPLADYCAKFIAYLFNNVGVKPKKTHFIGHSLGGQLAGFIGKRLLIDWMRKIERITGLDPAGPLFYPTHLNQRDAKFVDIIHTDGNGFGLDLAAGHIDFYPNGGCNPQPNCTNETFLLSDSCSHKMSWVMYAQTILNENLYIGNCTDDKRFPMGSATPSNARGKCTLQTSGFQSFDELKLKEFNLFDFIVFTPVRTFDFFWDLFS